MNRKIRRKQLSEEDVVRDVWGKEQRKNILETTENREEKEKQILDIVNNIRGAKYRDKDGNIDWEEVERRRDEINRLTDELQNESSEAVDDSDEDFWSFAGTFKRQQILRNMNINIRDVYDKILRDNPDLDEVENAEDYVVNWEINEMPESLKQEVLSVIRRNRSIYESYSTETNYGDYEAKE